MLDVDELELDVELDVEEVDELELDVLELDELLLELEELEEGSGGSMCFFLSLLHATTVTATNATITYLASLLIVSPTGHLLLCQIMSLHSQQAVHKLDPW